jgi:hypothetical protein
MAHRVLTDARGDIWDVWEVQPSSEASVWKEGWLAFQSRTDKRRITPVPAGWAQMTDEELRALLDRAESQGRPKRLIE